MKFFYKYKNQTVYVYTIRDKNDRIRDNILGEKINEQIIAMKSAQPLWDIWPKNQLATIYDDMTVDDFNKLYNKAQKVIRMQKKNENGAGDDSTKKTEVTNTIEPEVEEMVNTDFLARPLTVGKNILDFISFDLDKFITEHTYNPNLSIANFPEEEKATDNDKENYFYPVNDYPFKINENRVYSEEEKKHYYYQNIACMTEYLANHSYFICSFIGEIYDFEQLEFKDEGIKHFKAKQAEFAKIIQEYEKACRDVEMKMVANAKYNNLSVAMQELVPHYDDFVELDVNLIHHKIMSVRQAYNPKWEVFESIDEALEYELANMVLSRVSVFVCERCKSLSVGRINKKRCENIFRVTWGSADDIFPIKVETCKDIRRGKTNSQYRDLGHLEIYKEYDKITNTYRQQRLRAKGDFKQREDYFDVLEELKEQIPNYQEDYNCAKTKKAKEEIIKKYDELAKILWLEDDIDEWFGSHF